MNDKRLIGTWKSDARRNRKEIRARRDVFPSRAKREKFARIFGCLVIRYTRGTITTDFHGHRSRHPYKVLARDSQSVVIESFEKLCGMAAELGFGICVVYVTLWENKSGNEAPGGTSGSTVGVEPASPQSYT